MVQNAERRPQNAPSSRTLIKVVTFKKVFPPKLKPKSLEWKAGGVLLSNTKIPWDTA
jgi:hypothetical protein